MATDYTKSDAAKDTKSSTSQVAASWHQARDDSGVREQNGSDVVTSPPDWAEKTTESGISLFPES